jgi:hypothetical protein
LTDMALFPMILRCDKLYRPQNFMPVHPQSALSLKPSF